MRELKESRLSQPSNSSSARKLCSKRKKRNYKKKSKKSKNRSLSFINTVSTAVKEAWKPTRLGIGSIARGSIILGLKNMWHNHKMRKLKAMDHSTSVVSETSRASEELLDQIQNKLEESNRMVKHFDSMAEERLQSKVDQLRIF